MVFNTAQIDITESEKYINANEFFAENAEEYRAFWQDMQAKYPGWEIVFTYRNCDPPMEFLTGIGMELLESSFISELDNDGFKPAGKKHAMLITPENFDLFADFHDKASPDMFWTSARIAEKPEQWRIYMIGDDAYVMMSQWDDTPVIYALAAPDAAIGASLLSMAAKFAFDNNWSKVLYFIDTDNPLEMDAACEVGFVVTGKNLAYHGFVK
jgi:hypothetical protein